MGHGCTTETTGDSLIIRFDRPGIRNPLSVSVLDYLKGLFKDRTALDRYKAIIFTGTKDVFASGADLREIGQLTSKSAPGFAQRGQSLMNAIAATKPLTIAAVNGYCFGGALDLALACRRRVASSAAIFAHPGATLGIITGWGGTQRLPRLVGQANALEMFFAARRVDAKEALRIGLIDLIAEDVLDAAFKMASEDS